MQVRRFFFQMQGFNIDAISKSWLFSLEKFLFYISSELLHFPLSTNQENVSLYTRLFSAHLISWFIIFIIYNRTLSKIISHSIKMLSCKSLRSLSLIQIPKIPNYVNIFLLKQQKTLYCSTKCIFQQPFSNNKPEIQVWIYYSLSRRFPWRFSTNSTMKDCIALSVLQWRLEM